MKLAELAPTIDVFRSLGFGACIGTGTGLLVASAGLLPGQPNPYIVALGGGLVGTGLHLLIDFIVRWILQPISSAVSFYSKLLEAAILGRALKKEKREEVIESMILERLHPPRRRRPPVTATQRRPARVTKPARGRGNASTDFEPVQVG